MGGCGRLPVIARSCPGSRLYLGRQEAGGKAMATIELARAAISHAHAAQGMPKGDNPARHPVATGAIKGRKNQPPVP